VSWGDGAPAFGRSERVIDIAAFDPFDAKAVAGGADDARDLDRDLFLADFGGRWCGQPISPSGER
jgi:hypothetical protein